MFLQGKGFFTSNLTECEGGDPTSILATAQAAGLSHVVVKVADGGEACGLTASGIDFTTPVVQALHAAGIAVWGWHYVYGNNPKAEAAIAIGRTQALGLDGYVVNAEHEYQRPGMAEAARRFMSEVRGALRIPIAFRSYRFPNYHPELPWSTFLIFCDLHMPQVTWESAHDAGAQLRESKRQCDSLPNARPFIPTGAVYAASGWNPAAEDINDFLDTAKALELPAVNFFNWDTCRQKFAPLWETIASSAWPAHASTPAQAAPPIPPPEGFVAQFLGALNSRQAAQACALYDPDAIQVRAEQILPGAAAIQAGYEAFFDGLTAGTIFSVSQAQVEDDLYMFSWKAGSLSGDTTLVVKDGKIIQDYTFIA